MPSRKSGIGSEFPSSFSNEGQNLSFREYMDFDNEFTDKRKELYPTLMLTISDDGLYEEYEQLGFDLEQCRKEIREGGKPTFSIEQLEIRTASFLDKLTRFKAKSGK